MIFQFRLDMFVRPNNEKTTSDFIMCVCVYLKYIHLQNKSKTNDFLCHLFKCPSEQYMSWLYWIFSLKKTQTDTVSTSVYKWLPGINNIFEFWNTGWSRKAFFMYWRIENVIQYWKKLQTKRTQKSLLHDCLCESEIIDVMGGKSFTSWIRQICSLFGIESVINISHHEISSKFKSPFESMWKRQISKDMEWRTYCKIKEHFRYEDYLDDLKFCERRLVTKLRIRAHNFRIETDRHTRLITPLEERKCMQCTTGDIEHEFHVFIDCPKYAEKRLHIFKNIISECPSFATLNDESKFYSMLNFGGQFAKQVPDLLQYISSKKITREGLHDTCNECVIDVMYVYMYVWHEMSGLLWLVISILFFSFSVCLYSMHNDLY